MATQPKFDPYDSAVLTDLIRRPLEARVESENTIGEQLAPLLPVNAREVKLTVRDVDAFGVGQYKAPGATPPLMEPKGEYTERLIELVLLEEMHRIKDEDWLSLKSPDENIRRRAGLELVERGEILAIRNRRLTETMRWDAFSGSLDITYNSGAKVTVDYGIPAANKPTASVLWSNTASSDPIADITAWQELTANQLGIYATKLHMSNKIWLLLRQNDKIASYLTGSERPLLLPTLEDIQALLPYPIQFIVSDAGYRAEGQGTNLAPSSVTKYLPEDQVLLTTDYTIDGERIADVPDGQVLVSSGYNSVDIRRGPQAETILDHMSKTHFLRYASARIPRIHYPGAFVWGTVK